MSHAKGGVVARWATIKLKNPARSVGGGERASWERAWAYSRGSRGRRVSRGRGVGAASVAGRASITASMNARLRNKQIGNRINRRSRAPTVHRHAERISYLIYNSAMLEALCIVPTQLRCCLPRRARHAQSTAGYRSLFRDGWPADILPRSNSHRAFAYH
jgi:hypothetical protein